MLPWLPWRFKARNEKASSIAIDFLGRMLLTFGEIRCYLDVSRPKMNRHCYSSLVFNDSEPKAFPISLPSLTSSFSCFTPVKTILASNSLKLLSGLSILPAPFTWLRISGNIRDVGIGACGVSGYTVNLNGTEKKSTPTALAISVPPSIPGR